MQDWMFYIFAALTVICALLVVFNPFSRSPVTSAMFLVLTIISMAGLFVLLHAYFLAAVQILVYAGAVMVLFLFVIMLLDLKEEEHRRIRKAGAVLAFIAVGGVAGVFFKVFAQIPSTAGGTLELEGATAPLGRILFTQYIVPFEAVSVLLLVAMVGVILLSKKDLR